MFSAGTVGNCLKEKENVCLLPTCPPAYCQLPAAYCLLSTPYLPICLAAN
jgi:hypothetical protein